MMMVTDVVVIGAGAIGSATAYYLAREGLDVVVVDRGDVCSGTSSRCDGNVLVIDKQPGYDCQLTLYSQELFRELVGDLDDDFEYVCKGSTLAVESEADMEKAGVWVQQQCDAGVPMRLLSREEIHEQEPQLADDIAGAIECNLDSTLDPMALVFALINAARQMGAVVQSFTEVIGIRPCGRDVVVDTSSGSIRTRNVVNAAGVWSPAVGRMVGVEIPIKPRKGHILVAETAEGICSRKMMEFGYLMAKFGRNRSVEPDMEKYGVAMVFEPTGHGNFLIGSSREFVGFDVRVSSYVAGLQARRALRFFPCISGVNVIRCYAGVRPWTPDHLPVVSRVPGMEWLIVAAGHEGDGISLAPVTGRLVADIVVGRDSVVTREPLRFSRLCKEGEL